MTIRQVFENAAVAERDDLEVGMWEPEEDTKALFREEAAEFVGLAVQGMGHTESFGWWE